MKNRKRIYIIAISLFVALFLIGAEYTAHLTGLELRTFAQMVKGICVWLIIPCVVWWQGTMLTWDWLKQRVFENISGKSLKKTFLTVLHHLLAVMIFLAIACAGFLRGLRYGLTSEMVWEETLPDGYIKGVGSDLFTSEVFYYVPVGIVFREPFPGWSMEELVEKVQEKYSPEAELMEEQEDGSSVFRVPDKLAEGEYIYFHVENDYNLTSNGFFQVLLSEAVHFWENRDRMAALSLDGSVTLEDARDTGEEMRDVFSYQELCIACDGSAKDIAACAADLTDWLQFVRDTGQYPYEQMLTEDSAVLRWYLDMNIGTEESHFHLAPYSVETLQEYMGDDPWELRYQKMKQRLEEAFDSSAEKEENAGEKILQTEPSEEQSEPYSAFMENYDGSCEKECLVEDGTVRYRMVVMDAALGHRAYGLLKSTDGGESWELFSPTPFGQQMGMGIDFVFLSEDFGFATLTHSGGDEAVLYVTEDGGLSYQETVMQGYTVSLEDGYTYNPYDYPQMPYEEDGVIYVLCGQGADGDYDGGDEAGLALYQSTDKGHTFSFVKIQKRE